METTTEKLPETPTPPVGDSPMPKATVVTPDELALPLAENMPEPTGPLQTPIDDFPPDPNAPQSTPAPTEEKKGIKDATGNVFDATKYKTDEKGAPRLDKAGHFIPLNKGRKPKAGKETENEKPEATQTAAQFTNTTGVPDEFDNAAALYFDVATGVLAGTISEEWQPESDVERAGMIKAVAAYLRAKGSVEITPGQALLFAGIAYSGKRLNKPKTKEKLTLWFLKLKGMFQKPQAKLN